MTGSDVTNTNPGAMVAHVFVTGPDGLCVCGRERFTGGHVADTGAPEPDLSGLAEACDVIEAQLAVIRRVLGGRP